MPLLLHTLSGVVLKLVEPLDSARPSKKWRLYVFKNEEISETLHLHRQSAYLFGRDKRVADIELKHESCSKQHAVIQYRQEIIYCFVRSIASRKIFDGRIEVL